MAKTQLLVAPANQGQAHAWDGDEGAYWAEHADVFDRSVAAYHDALMDAAEITSTSRVLDVGCGAGQTTRDAARRAPSGSALGVDLSSRLIELAGDRARGEGLGNVAFEQGDAQTYPFQPASFDVAISRTGAMFFGDPVAAFANIGRSLDTTGQLALLSWQPVSENEWFRAIASALAAGRELPMPPPNAPGPFGLSEPERVRSILSEAGFADIELTGRREPMWFGANADAADRFILGLLSWMLREADESTRRRGIDDLHRATIDHDTRDGVVFGSAAWLITARRTA
jgi:SAM-dependent methyltransferase